MLPPELEQKVKAKAAENTFHLPPSAFCVGDILDGALSAV